MKLFPDNSEDATAYFVGAGGAEVGYVLMNSFFKANSYVEMLFPMLVGLFVSALFHWVFRKHFSTFGEDKWVMTGRGHWIVFRLLAGLPMFLLRG